MQSCPRWISFTPEPTGCPACESFHTLCSPRHGFIQSDGHGGLAERDPSVTISLHTEQERLNDHDMFADAAIFSDFENAVLTQHFLRGHVQEGVSLNVWMVDYVIVACRVARKMWDNAVAGS